MWPHRVGHDFIHFLAVYIFSKSMVLFQSIFDRCFVFSKKLQVWNCVKWVWIERKISNRTPCISVREWHFTKASALRPILNGTPRIPGKGNNYIFQSQRLPILGGYRKNCTFEIAVKWVWIIKGTSSLITIGPRDKNECGLRVVCSRESSEISGSTDRQMRTAWRNVFVKFLNREDWRILSSRIQPSKWSYKKAKSNMSNWIQEDNRKKFWL